MSWNRSLAFAALAACLLIPTHAAQGDGLTIEKAVAIALAGNPEVRAAAVEVDAARGRTLQFAARPEPQLSASIEAIPSRGRSRRATRRSSTWGSSSSSNFPASGRCGRRSAGWASDSPRPSSTGSSASWRPG